MSECRLLCQRVAYPYFYTIVCTGRAEAASEKK